MHYHSLKALEKSHPDGKPGKRQEKVIRMENQKSDTEKRLVWFCCTVQHILLALANFCICHFVSFIFNLKPAVKTFWSLSNVTLNIALKACVMLYLWSSQYFQIHKCHKPQNSGNAKPDNYLDTCVAVTYFFSAGFIHSNSVTYSQSKKTEVTY